MKRLAYANMDSTTDKLPEPRQSTTSTTTVRSFDPEHYPMKGREKKRIQCSDRFRSRSIDLGGRSGGEESASLRNRSRIRDRTQGHPQGGVPDDARLTASPTLTSRETTSSGAAHGASAAELKGHHIAECPQTQRATIALLCIALAREPRDLLSATIRVMVMNIGPHFLWIRGAWDASYPPNLPADGD